MLPKPSSCVGCPLYERPHGKKTGFSLPDGTGKNGVMIVVEALGETEEQEGRGLVGKSGYTLFQELKSLDIEREDFTIFNTVACRPPDNKLVGMPYEAEAISHCAPNLDKAIADAKQVARANNKTFVIVTLGVTAFKRVMGYDRVKDRDLLKKDYHAYPFWSDTYSCWVFNAPHPAYLVRGNTHLWPVVHFVFSRALEVAQSGLLLDEPNYLLDPSPNGFDAWIDGYRRRLMEDPDAPLSYDIETPYKKRTKDEEELGKDESADHTILRCAFSYYDRYGCTQTTSVVWDASYMAGIEALFGMANYVLGWNSDKYDYPRVTRYVDVKGIGLDGMVAWHILNTSLPKALGFVTPYYWQNTTMWKHLADAQPAFYNAKDADAALRNFMGIKSDLIKNNLWHVYESHWIELHKALKYMSGKGVLRDNEMRDAAESQLQLTLDAIERRMEEAVPIAARELKIAQKKPKNLEGWTETLKDYPKKYCKACGVVSSAMRSAWHKKCGETLTVSLPVPKTVWTQPKVFKISKKRMTNYQQVLKHQAILSRKERKMTFDADALTMLVKKYPKDKLYPTILEHRKVQKILSTYIGVTNARGVLVGGMQAGKDGRIHTQYGRDASTLRFTSEDPNLQNLPRPNKKDSSDPANIVRNLIVASPGHRFGAVDYAGIEAVLVGYFALYPEYIRLALQDVHTYLTVYGIYETEGSRRIQAADLPELSWPDERLFPYLKQLKKEFSEERNKLYKHIGHAFNFGQSPRGTQAKVYSETGVEYPLKTLQRLQDIYFALFPKIRQWQKNVTEQAEKDRYLRNPFDYVHRFARAFDYTKEFGEWIKKPGPDWNAIIAFKPQSTAVGIITEAILELYHNRFEEAGQYLRLQVHDELLFEAPLDIFDNVLYNVSSVMGRPIPQLAMPESWKMGPYLRINTESKQGQRWGEME